MYSFIGERELMDSSLCRQSLEMMLKVPAEEIDEAVVFPLLQNKDEKIQELAIQVLAKTHHPALFPFLVHNLEVPMNLDVVILIRCLEELKNPSGALSLLKYLADRNPKVRLAAAHAFATFGEDAMLLAIHHWMKMGREDRVAVIRTFGQFVVGGYALFSQAIKDDDWWVRSETIKVLGKSLTPFVVDLLLASLNDEFAWVRAEAIRGLQGRKNKKIQPAILPLTRDVNQEVAIAAAHVLRKCI